MNRCPPAADTRAHGRRPGGVRALVAGVLVACATGAMAQDEPQTVPQTTEPQALPIGEPEAPHDAPAEASPHWEGALGLIVNYGPEYSGSDRYGGGVTPGFFLRWGRWTVTNASAFVTRRADDITRGLGVDLVSSRAWRVNATLRLDGGRDEDSSPDLAGMGDIDSTVRVRLSANWRFDPRWRLGGSWTLDALGRGGGQLAELSLVREHALSPTFLWTVGTAVSVGSSRYMQTYYGVSEEQSQRSGYPVYSAHGGLRGVSLNASWRRELGEHWLMLGNASANLLLDSAQASPIVRQAFGWGASLSAAYRF